MPRVRPQRPEDVRTQLCRSVSATPKYLLLRQPDIEIPGPENLLPALRRRGQQRLDARQKIDGCHARRIGAIGGREHDGVAGFQFRQLVSGGMRSSMS